MYLYDTSSQYRTDRRRQGCAWMVAEVEQPSKFYPKAPKHGEGTEHMPKREYSGSLTGQATRTMSDMLIAGARAGATLYGLSEAVCGPSG